MQDTSSNLVTSTVKNHFMITFAEHCAGAPFDWNVALAQKNISATKWEILDELACKWITCAVGNQCNVIPRNKWGCPLDNTLCELGEKFSLAIGQHRKIKAKNILLKIEQRSAELISQLSLNP